MNKTCLNYDQYYKNILNTQLNNTYSGNITAIISNCLNYINKNYNINLTMNDSSIQYKPNKGNRFNKINIKTDYSKHKSNNTKKNCITSQNVELDLKMLRNALANSYNPTEVFEQKKIKDTFSFDTYKMKILNSHKKYPSVEYLLEHYKGYTHQEIKEYIMHYVGIIKNNTVIMTSDLYIPTNEGIYTVQDDFVYFFEYSKKYHTNMYERIEDAISNKYGVTFSMDITNIDTEDFFEHIEYYIETFLPKLVDIINNNDFTDIIVNPPIVNKNGNTIVCIQVVNNKSFVTDITNI